MKSISEFSDILKKIFGIMNAKTRVYAVVVFVIIFISSLLELLGITVLIPFISAVIEPDMLESNEYVVALFESIGVHTGAEKIVCLGILIVIVYLIKNLFLMVSLYVQTRFKWGLRRKFTKEVFSSYMSRPYSYFINAHSAELLRGVDSDIYGYYESLDQFFAVSAASMIIVVLSIFILVTDIQLALTIFGAAIFCVVFVFGMVKKVVIKAGDANRAAIAERVKVATQSIALVKEIFITKTENRFIEEFDEACEKERKSNIKSQMIYKTPEKIIEVVFVIGVVVYVSTLVVGGENLQHYIPQLSAFAVAIMKMLPNVYTISNGLSYILFYKSAVESTYQNIIEIDKTKLLSDSNIIDSVTDSSEGLNRKEDDFVIRAEGISWKYENSERQILNSVNLVVSKGDAIALIGKSGAGKTTMADVLLGLLPIKEGSVTINDINIKDIPYEWSRFVGYVPQSVNLLDDSIRANVMFVDRGEAVDESKIWDALDKAQIGDFVRSLPEQLDTMIGDKGIRLSGGQRQRLAIARTLYYNPELIVFDEATSSLDVETEKALMDSITQLRGSKTLIIIAHRLETIRLCDKVYEVKDSQIIEKDKEEILSAE